MKSNAVIQKEQNQRKRKQLKEIVSELGADATTDEIRQASYIRGVGRIAANMLVSVRNELFPSREKRGGGRPRGAEESEHMEVDGNVAFRCQCGSSRVGLIGSYRARDSSGSVKKFFKCKQCDNRFSVDAVGDFKTNYRRSAAEAAIEKRCRACRKIKPIDEFSLRSSLDTLRRPNCKECYCVQRAVHAKGTLEKKYGITESEYQQMLSFQGGVCAICKKRETHRNVKHRELSIDHCHVTGEVRGLLCAKCNLGIGHFLDDPELVLSAYEYLARSTRE